MGVQKLSIIKTLCQIDATVSQKTILKKFVWAKFLHDFQIVYTKIFKKACSFQKNIIKNIQAGLKGPKIIKN